MYVNNKGVVFILFFYLLLFASFTTVWGAGFHIHEQSAKAMGMGNAFVGLADDPSALFYNPAGIAFQKGTQIDLGCTAISVPNTKFRGSTKLGNNQASPALGVPLEHVEEKARRDVFLPPNFYVVHSFEDVPVSVGLSLNAIYSLSKRWESDGAFQDEVKDISIRAMNLQPTVAYRIDKYHLAFAVGIDYTYATLRLKKSVYADRYLLVGGYPGQAAEHLGDLEYDGDADGWGYNFGVLWKPLDCLSLGLSYRSKIVLKADGNADFTRFFGPYAGFHGHGDVTINLPDSWSFGVAYRPAKAWTLTCDVERYGWSSFKKLEANFDSRATIPDYYSEKDWEDSWAFRFGVQYDVSERFSVRAGYAYDRTPTPERTLGPELPDADRSNYTVGFSYRQGHVTFDMAYMLVVFQDRHVDNAIQTGTYESKAYLLGANLTYAF